MLVEGKDGRLGQTRGTYSQEEIPPSADNLSDPFAGKTGAQKAISQ